MAWNFRRAMVGRSMTLPPMMVLRGSLREPPQTPLLTCANDSHAAEIGANPVPRPVPLRRPVPGQLGIGDRDLLDQPPAGAIGSSAEPQRAEASASGLSLEPQRVQASAKECQLESENARLRHELQAQSKHLTCLERELTSLRESELKLQEQMKHVESLEKELITLRASEQRLQDLSVSASSEILNLRSRVAELEEEQRMPQVLLQAAAGAGGLGLLDEAAAEIADLKRQVAELQSDQVQCERLQSALPESTRPVERQISAPPVVYKASRASDADEVCVQADADSGIAILDSFEMDRSFMPHVDECTPPGKARFAKAFQRPRAKAVDDIDERLLTFLESTPCSLQFRRINRGWYQFWPLALGVSSKPGHADAKHVELSIVNGKLMARMEPLSLDPGWNKGRPGAIERFVAAVTKS